MKDERKEIKTEFAAEDLDIEHKAIDTIPSDNKQIEWLKEEMNRLWQVLHNKGLEVGLPSVIVDDINEIAVSLNSMRGLLIGDALKQKWRDDDERITKLLNKGEVHLAHHERMMQVIELRESVGKLDSFHFDLINRLNRLQKRMIGKDKYDLER